MSEATNGKPQLGPFMKFARPEMIEVVALAGFDFALVDMEHGPVGHNELYAAVLAAERRNLQLIVRIPVIEEPYFKWCLDLGVRHIQVPSVETPEDVAFCIRNSYFDPQGMRGLCRFTRAADFGAKPRDGYLAEANGKTQLILQIEGQRGVANLPEILAAAPYGSILFIGPYDLSQSLGKPGQIWDREVVAQIEAIVAKCEARELGVGIFTDTPEGVRFWAERGVGLIEYGSDLNVFMAGAAWLRKEAGLER
ncbi:MAG: aldolase [Alphaproteobacteria bacterium]|nr:aldolase [Alphaproteobacteria bacterium]